MTRQPLDSPVAAYLRFTACVAVLLGAAGAQDQGPRIDLSQMHLRRLGPASMAGRVVDLAVDEKHPTTFFVATASGGLWKTVNNGTTFEPLFQNEKVMSIGAIALDPSDANSVWVGTGEANNRNSSSWGGGVFHSKDGGKTWAYKGLPKSFHIARVAVHPKDPKTVFVAACGSLWGPNKERGLYRTKDGGATWQLVLKKDSKTGATEIRIDPKNPDILYCALYERQRDGFDGNHPAKRWGKGSGIYKSTDGGDTWTHLTKGLPTVKMGRIQLEVYRKDPSHVYALIETEKIGQRPEGAPPPERGEPGTALMGIGSEGSDAPAGAKLTEVTSGGPAAKAGLKAGDVVLGIGGHGTTSYAELLAVLGDERANDKTKIKVLRGKKVLTLDITWGDRRSQQGGRRGRGGFADRIGGQVANRMRQQGPNGFQTGGLFLSKDRGATWERINTLNPRPYYFSQFRVDPSDNKNIYVPGINFHFSFDGGKTFATRSRDITMAGVHVDFHAMWINPNNGKHILLGCDGGVNISYDRCKSWESFENLDIGQAYHAVADTRRPYWVYAGYQDNGSWGSPSQTYYAEGIMNSDVFKIGGGDGFVCRVDKEDPNVVFSESQGGNIGWQNIMTGQRGRVSRGGNAFRQQRGGQDRSSRPSFNWNTPFFLSAYNAKTLYFAGNRAFKSVDRGRTTKPISGDLTRGAKPGASARPSASVFVESPRQQGVLWAGTDDGKVWLTQDDGKSWKDLSNIVADLLPNGRPMWIGSIHPSRYKTSRAYLTVDGHRSNDRRPYVFVTEDFGQKWKRIDVPEGVGSARRIYEDTKNEDLLWLGGEMGLWVSMDRGASWAKMSKNFPSVTVLDFDTQEREEHLIIATHGRSVWALDIRPLRALTAANRKKASFLVQPNDVFRMARRSRSKSGHRHFKVPNPPTQATFYYWLAKNTKESVRLVVRDVLGKELWSVKGSQKAGLHRADWNLRRARRGVRGVARAVRRRFGRGGGGGVAAGTYSVTLEVGKAAQVASFPIEDSRAPLDVSWPRPAAVGEGGSVTQEAAAGNVNEEGEGRDARRDR